MKKKPKEEPEQNANGIIRKMLSGGKVIGSNIRQAALKVKFPEVIVSKPIEEQPRVEERKAVPPSNGKSGPKKEKRAH